MQAVADPVKHFSSRHLFEGTINATLNWHFGLRGLIFQSLLIFFEGNSVARVSPSVTGTLNLVMQTDLALTGFPTNI